MSPIATIGSKPLQDWDQEIFYPVPRSNDNLGVGMVVNDTRYLSKGITSYASNEDNRLISSLSVIGTGTAVYTANPSGGLVSGYPQLRIRAAAAAPDNVIVGLEGMSAYLATLTPDPNPLALGARFSSMNRSYWFKANLRYVDDGLGFAGNDQGILIMPGDAPQHGWPTQPVGGTNRGGFGIVGDGAGQWVYRSFDRTGAPLIRETIVLPVHIMNEIHTVEWLFVGTRPGAPAYIEFWFNNVLIATRNWTGVLLEPIGGAAAGFVDEWRWTPHLMNTGLARIYVSQCVARYGRFLRDGTEITG